MDHPLKREDYLTLHHIVQQAHYKSLKQSKFNKQSQTNQQPAFNILRVLTAFKQIFPTTPEKLYKLILVITKKYNPQTLDQWRKAIEKLNTIEFSKNSFQKQKINLNTCFNQSTFNQQNKPNFAINHQNTVKTYKEELDSQIDFIESKRSRLKFADYRITEPSWVGTDHHNQQNKQNVMQFSNKNSLRNSQYAHLISFQPNQSRQNSSKLKNYTQNFNFNQTQKFQNQKKINPYHEITKIDNLSLIDQRQPSSKDQSKTLYSQNYRTQQNSRLQVPYKTQRDHSIIHGCKDSESSMIKSQMIQTQKINQISEYQDFNMTLQQWEFLNERTTTFYQFNIKLKGFSALLANYQAFQSDRAMKSKANIFHETYIASKVFIGLRQNIEIQRDYKQKLQKSEYFHSKSLYSKAWKVLDVLKKLKISSSKKNIQLQKLNRINYEFFLNFMFEQKELQNSPRRQADSNNFQFQKKAQYFTKTRNFQNVWNIYKYFGLNIQINKNQLEVFFQNYHRCLTKNIFEILKKNRQEQKFSYLNIHQSRLIGKSFSILKARLNAVKQQKKFVFKAQSWKNKRLKQKSFKILLSIVYSTKIFSKRQAYIQTQRKNKIKKQVLRLINSKGISVLSIKKQKEQNVRLLCQKISQFVKKISFNLIRQDSSKMQQKMIKCQKYSQQKLVKKFFKHFFTLLSNKKAYIDLCQSNEAQFKKRYLKKWLHLVNIKKSIISIEKNFKKIIFRQFFIPLAKNIVKSYLLNQEQERNIVKQCFEQLNKFKQVNQNTRLQLTLKSQKMILKNSQICLLKYLKVNKLSEQNSRKLKEIQQNTIYLSQYLEGHKNKTFLVNIEQILAQKKDSEAKIAQVRYQIQKSSLYLINRNIQQSKNQHSNYVKLQNHLKKSYFFDFAFQIKKNQNERKQNEIKQRSQKRIGKQILNKIMLKCKQMKEKQQKSTQYFTKLTQRKVMVSLVKQFIQTNEKSQKIQKYLKESKTNDIFKIFVLKTKRELMTRKNTKITLKKQVFSQLGLNLLMKIRQKEVQLGLKMNKIDIVFNSFQNSRQIDRKKEIIQNISNSFKKKLFLMRFNNFFISKLFEKKHIFMVYKFRALKLYQSSFRNWREIIIKKQNKIGLKKQNRNVVQKQSKYQIWNNDQSKQKQVCHMYKPTQSS